MTTNQDLISDHNDLITVSSGEYLSLTIRNYIVFNVAVSSLLTELVDIIEVTFDNVMNPVSINDDIVTKPVSSSEATVCHSQNSMQSTMVTEQYSSFIANSFNSNSENANSSCDNDTSLVL
ncbi:hypothetical protein GJ496_010460, partial [Pomphorhynchus laevis]